MATRTILVEGDPALLKKSRRIVKFDDRLAMLADDMTETMYSGDGVGLAAPQVGVLRRLFVMDTGDGDGPVTFVNPEILSEEGEQRGIEGCLSLPGLVGIVPRPLTVRVRAQDVAGTFFEKTYTGLAARCVCHETDHLDGILYRQRSETVLCTLEEFEEQQKREREKSICFAFMGTPVFATVVLNQLEQAGYLPSLVITQPDRPSGRGKTLTAPPAAVWAKDRQIPLIQPASCRDPALADALRELSPEVIVTASFGQYLPPSILSLPEKGCVNVHASLLPKYRGSSPIQAAILSGDKETGVTLMVMDKGFDTGPVIAKAAYPIDDEIDAGQLSLALAKLGGELVARELPRYLAGEITAAAQDESAATETHMLRKEDGRVDFNKSARDVHNHIRAMSPWPGAFAYLNGKRYKLLRSRVHACGGDACGAPGEIRVSGHRMFISCAEGAIELLNIQAQSGSAMCVDQCAHNFECGALFCGAEES